MPHEVLPQCEEAFQGIRQTLERHEGNLDRIEKAVVGPNGQSLVERVAAIESSWRGVVRLLGVMVAVATITSVVIAAWK